MTSLRRRAALLAVAALVVAGLAVPAGGQTLPPTITISPTCGPVGTPINLTVAGAHWRLGQILTLTITVTGFSALAWNDSQNSGRTGTFNTVFPNTSIKNPPAPVPNQPGVYTITYADQFQESASANYTVPCTPPPTTTTTSTTLPATTTTSTTRPVTSTSGATTTSTSSTTSTTAPTAHLVVDPGLGPTGAVARVTGSGFAPGPVTLSWQPGNGGTAATADAAGTFQVYVLVLPKDIIGPRQLVATISGVIQATAPFLVVPGTVQPGDWSYRR